MNETPFAVVIGAVNIDIGGTSRAPVVAEDSNPGTVQVTMGGVGRNIAENLARLGMPVSMLTVLGDDSHAAALREHSAQVGIDLSRCITIPGGRTSTYLCLNHPNGDIYAAVSDMGIYEHLTPALLAPHLEWLNTAAVVVVDANLPEETIAWAVEHITAPVCLDPVSTLKAGKLKGHMRGVAAIKPNRAEATLLTGIDTDTREGLQAAAAALLFAGVKNVFLSMSAEGVYYTDGRDSGIQPIYPSAMVNTSGCGDAFLAAAAYALAKGMTIPEAAQMGQAASAVCAESVAAVNPLITIERVMERMEEK